jgi:serine/threonine protein kinase
MMTEDIDYTVDLDERAAQADAFAHQAASLRLADDVPFHDEVPPAAREQRFPVAPGRVLSDRFVLTKLLGTGGSCSVYLARDLEADRNRDKPAFVALKTPRPDSADPAKASARLQREFEHARGLSHPTIVRVFELACDGDVWFMTMELLEGESLAALMRRHASALPAHLARRALRGIAEALAYAHAGGVVHGDLNPANVFIINGERVKLLDFGAACRENQAPAAAATLAYASPQVLSGETPQPRDDAFAFGCIAYQVLTGAHPFEQRSSLAARDAGLRPPTPADLTNEQTLALMSGLSWDRDARPDDVRSLAAALAPESTRRRVVVAEPEPDTRTPPPSDVRWWLLGVVSLVAMVAAVLATRLS